jgi:hypothetical protein
MSGKPKPDETPKSRIKTATEWAALILTLGGVMAGLVAAVRWTVKQDLDTLNVAIAGLKTDTSRIEGELQATNKKIDDLLSRCLERAFSTPTSAGASKGKGSAGNVDAVNSIIKTALDLDVRLSRPTVNAVGRRMIALSASPQPPAPRAWMAVVSMLDYVSVTNTPPSISWTKAPNILPSGNPAPFGVTEMANVQIYASAESVPVAENLPVNTLIGQERDVIEMLGRAGLSRYPAAIMYIGKPGSSKIVLDGLHLAHTVLKNFHVIYGGGPTIVEDVYFLNCTFELRRTNETAQFAEKALTEFPILFHLEV